MGVTLLPRAVVERADLARSIRAHALTSVQRRVDTHSSGALRPTTAVRCRSFLGCLKLSKVPTAA